MRNREADRVSEEKGGAERGEVEPWKIDRARYLTFRCISVKEPEHARVIHQIPGGSARARARNRALI